MVVNFKRNWNKLEKKVDSFDSSLTKGEREKKKEKVERL